jgi:hypothetical protein
MGFLVVFAVATAAFKVSILPLFFTSGKLILILGH